MVVIVGAGITGLALGAHLTEKGIPFKLFEAQDRVGGNITTIREQGYTFEAGPNSLQLTDELYNWLEELGLEKEIIQADPRAKYRYVLKDGKYRKLPTGPVSLLSSPVFSFAAKRNALGERSVPKGTDPNETIAQFFRRRVGDELTEYVVFPFISGVYAGNPETLIMKEAFPKLVELEQQHGSLIKGMFASRTKRKHKGIFSFKNGLGQMAERLTDKISGEIHLNHSLKGLKKTSSGFEVLVNDQVVSCEKIVFALPSHAIASILAKSYPEFSQSLQHIYYPPVSVVHSVYKREDVNHPLDGFGALHNHKEETRSLGTIFSSSVFPSFCKKDEVLLTTFMGGSLYPQQANEEGIFDRLHDDHQRFLGVNGKALVQKVKHWPLAIPQYDEHIKAYQGFVPAFEKQGCYFGGNWIGGISVASCLERAKLLAEKIENPIKS